MDLEIRPANWASEAASGHREDDGDTLQGASFDKLPKVWNRAGVDADGSSYSQRHKPAALALLFRAMTRISGSSNDSLDATTRSGESRRSVSSEALNSKQLLHFGGRWDHPDVSRSRKCLAKGEASAPYQMVFLLIVLIDLVFVALESNATATGEEVALWVSNSSRFLLLFYVLEIAVRIYIHRLQFFQETANLFDSFIVLLDVIIVVIGMTIGLGSQSGESDTELVNSVSMFRCVRLMQLARSYKAIRFFPELSLMMRGLLGALRSVVWGIVFIAFLFAIFGIIGVQIIHPLNLRMISLSGLDCDRCERAYSTVFQCMMTFTQQLIAGDSWGQYTIPIIEQFPATMLYFGSLLVLSNLLVLNMVLGLILDAAYIARRGTDQDVAAQKEKMLLDARQELFDLCAAMDTDGSGSLSREEILDGATASAAFKSCLHAMDVHDEDMEVMCSILDKRGTGEVDYSDFADGLHKMKTSDAHTMLVFIKQYVKEIRTAITLEVNCKLMELELQMSRMTKSGATGPSEDAEEQLSQIPSLVSRLKSDCDSLGCMTSWGFTGAFHIDNGPPSQPPTERPAFASPSAAGGGRQLLSAGLAMASEPSRSSSGKEHAAAALEAAATAASLGPPKVVTTAGLPAAMAANLLQCETCVEVAPLEGNTLGGCPSTKPAAGAVDGHGDSCGDTSLRKFVL